MIPNYLKSRHNDFVRKKGLSIRYKLLIVLTVIPLISLALFLVLAVKIFEKDKVAYVFETSSVMTSNVASQFRNYLDGKLRQVQPLLLDCVEDGKFASVSLKIFENEPALHQVVAFRRDSSVAGDQNKYQVQQIIEKHPGSTRPLLQALKQYLEPAWIEIQKEGRLAKVPYLDDRLFLLERVVDVKTKRDTVFLIVFQISDIVEQFHSDSGVELFLLDGAGRVLAGPEGSLGKPLQNFLSLDLEKQNNTNFQSALETRSLTSKTKGKLLISYAKVGFGDLAVLSSVVESQALQATKVLLRTSLLFFGILISAIIIISLFTSKTITAALRDLFHATQRVAEGNFNIHVEARSHDEVGALAQNFNLMAAEVSRLLDQTAEKARMENELRTARTVQETLFPETDHKIGDLSISGFYEPASECGGDWWHYSQIGQRVLFWIGDATGHGAPAALITSAAKSAATIAELLSLEPKNAMEFLNRAIHEVSKGRLMMTFFIGCYDLKTHEFLYANASHEAPFLLKYKREGPLKKKEIHLLNDVNGPRLGQSLNCKYEQFRLELEPGDRVLFYTDGISAIENSEHLAWGDRHFIKSIVQNHFEAKSTRDFVDRFSRDFGQHRQSNPLIDDVTFFIIERNSREA